MGTIRVHVSVSDGNGGKDFRNFNITVENTNDPPVIQTTALPDGTGGQAYNYSLIASDVDGDSLVWSLETNASWLMQNSSTGVLNGTPSSAGSFWVYVSAYDGQGGNVSVNLTFSIQQDPDNIPDTEDNEDDDERFHHLILFLLILIFIILLGVVSILVISVYR